MLNSMKIMLGLTFGLVVALAGCGSAAPSLPASSPAPAQHSTTRAVTSTAARTSPPPPAATTTAPPPPPPTTTAPLPPATTTAPAPPPPPTAASCYPLTSSGNCYEPGEFCPKKDYGASGIAGDGKAITCENNDGWRWEPS